MFHSNAFKEIQKSKVISFQTNSKLKKKNDFLLPQMNQNFKRCIFFLKIRESFYLFETNANVKNQIKTKRFFFNEIQ